MAARQWLLPTMGLLSIELIKTIGNDQAAHTYFWMDKQVP